MLETVYKTFKKNMKRIQSKVRTEYWICFIVYRHCTLAVLILWGRNCQSKTSFSDEYANRAPTLKVGIVECEEITQTISRLT